MGNVLAFCETNGSNLRTNALANIAFARRAAAAHDGDLILLLIGDRAAEAGPEAAKYAERVITVDDDELEHYMVIPQLLMN